MSWYMIRSADMYVLAACVQIKPGMIGKKCSFKGSDKREMCGHEPPWICVVAECVVRADADVPEEHTSS